MVLEIKVQPQTLSELAQNSCHISHATSYLLSKSLISTQIQEGNLFHLSMEGVAKNFPPSLNYYTEIEIIIIA